MPLLELERVSKRFGGAQALDDVSVDLRAGEVHALVGENGAGKSTLLNIISGVHRPDSGQVKLDGRPIVLGDPVAARRLGIRVVRQEAELFEPLSVAENMALEQGLPTNSWGIVRWRQVEKDAREAIASFREPIDERLPAHRLSVAHRHLTEIAAALHAQPRVLLLDEPTSSLTGPESQWLHDQVARARAAGVGVLYISHHLDEVLRLSQRITVLRDGRAVWSGRTESIDRERLIEWMVGRSERETTTGSIHRDCSANAIRFECRGLSDIERRCQDVSLIVRAGEIVGVYGLVGAGRSEWAQTVFGLRQRKQGDILIDGRPASVKSATGAKRQGLAYLPEDRLRQGIFRGLRVKDNLVVSSLARLTRWGLLLGPPERVAAERQIAVLDVRPPQIDAVMGSLSGGNQQKVVFGRWRLTEPKVLILDEPTRGVDVGAKREIHRFLRRWADEGRAVVMISSDLPEVLENADRVVVFRAGRISAEFSKGEASPASLARAALPTSAVDPSASLEETRPFGWRIPREFGLIIALSALFAGLWWTSDRFSTVDNVLGILDNAATRTVLALGAAVVILAGGIDISMGSLLGLSAAASGLTMSALGPSPLSAVAGIAVGLAVGVVGGLTNASITLMGRIHPIVVTLGMMTVYRGLVLTVTGGNAIHNVNEHFRSALTRSIAGVSGVAILALSISAAVHFFLSSCRRGRWLRALGASPSAAALVGIRTSSGWLLAFGLGGLLAGMAGLMELALTGTMQSRLGTGDELSAISAAVIGGVAVIGGRGRVPGVVLGAILLSMIQNALVIGGVSPNHYELVSGALLAGAIVIDRMSTKGET